MKRIIISIIIIAVVIIGCSLYPSVGIPPEAELIRGVNDPVTIYWTYTPEVDVTDYTFDFLMCDITANRLTGVQVVANIMESEYTFTVADLNVGSDTYVLGVRAVENGVTSSAIWSDLSADTAGGTFYADENGLWMYNAPTNIGVRGE